MQAQKGQSAGSQGSPQPKRVTGAEKRTWMRESMAGMSRPLCRLPAKERLRGMAFRKVSRARWCDSILLVTCLGLPGLETKE